MSVGVRECGSVECGSGEVRECGSAGVGEWGSVGVWECVSAGVWECGSAVYELARKIHDIQTIIGIYNIDICCEFYFATE